MSRENVERMKGSNEAFNRGDVEATLAFYHPQVQWRDLHSPPDVPEYVTGIPALREIWEGWRRAVGLHAHVEEYIDAGEFVVCVTRWDIEGSTSGLGVGTRFAEVYEFEEGLIVRATVGYASRSDALRALGLEA